MSVQTLSDKLIDRAYAEVVPLLQRMVGFDTTIRDHDDAPRRDREHQQLVAGYLRELAAEVEVFEPELEEIRDHPMYRPNQTFEGRPIIWARLPGHGGGRSLALQRSLRHCRR